MKKFWYLLWPVMFAAYSFAVYGLMPFHDDWSYATAPNPDFSWPQLLPGAAFWRPFDVLWGAAMMKVPQLFPDANRLAIVLAHTISSFVVYKILAKLPKDRVSHIAGALFFALSSALAATMFNSDAINQAWSFLFGALALLMALGKLGETRVGWVGVYGTIFLSMLFKESGISWFGVIPLVMYFKNRNWRKFLLGVGVGAIVAIAYFGLRFALMGEIVLGDGQYYTLGFNFESVVVNLFVALFLPFSGVDMLAYACEHWILFILSILLSLAFWSMWIESADKHDVGMKSAIVIFVALALAAPHCFFLGHHVAEMHFYPIVFAGALLVALLSGRKERQTLRICGILIMIGLFACGWSDKITEVHKHSDRARVLYRELEEKGLDFSKPIYFIAEADLDVKYYSVFTESAGHALDWGKACRAMNGWRDFDYHLAATSDQRVRIPVSAQMVWIK